MGQQLEAEVLEAPLASPHSPEGYKRRRPRQPLFHHFVSWGAAEGAAPAAPLASLPLPPTPPSCDTPTSTLSLSWGHGELSPVLRDMVRGCAGWCAPCASRACLLHKGACRQTSGDMWCGCVGVDVGVGGDVCTCARTCLCA